MRCHLFIVLLFNEQTQTDESIIINIIVGRRPDPLQRSKKLTSSFIYYIYSCYSVHKVLEPVWNRVIEGSPLKWPQCRSGSAHSSRGNRWDWKSKLKTQRLPSSCGRPKMESQREPQTQRHSAVRTRGRYNTGFPVKVELNFQNWTHRDTRTHTHF